MEHNSIMASIDEAFRKIKRADFLPDPSADALLDAPISIGFGQTNSQPSTVRLMLEWLDLGPGDKVLDIGSGSGWTTALIACIVGAKGKVYGVERIEELLRYSIANCARLGISGVKFYQAGKSFGLKKHAPYDRILVSAAYHEIPQSLLSQLKAGGKLVLPVDNDILEITKKSSEDIEMITHPGFVFVPLIKG